MAQSDLQPPEVTNVDGSSVSPVESRSNEPLSPASWEIAVGAVTPPSLWSPQSRIEWVTFARYPNALAARIVGGRLEVEGVPVILEAMSVFPGTPGAALWVPRQLLHRAHWVMAWPAPSEAEFAFLATGELVPDNEVQFIRSAGAL